MGAKYKWKQHDEAKFQAALTSIPCQKLVADFLNADLNSLPASDAAQAVHNMYETAATISGIQKSGSKRKKTKKKQYKKWYDRDCLSLYRDITKRSRLLR